MLSLVGHGRIRQFSVRLGQAVMEWYVDVGHGKLCSGGLGRSVTARFVEFRYGLAGRGRAVKLWSGLEGCVGQGLVSLGGLGWVRSVVISCGTAWRGGHGRSWDGSAGHGTVGLGMAVTVLCV